MLIVPPVPAVRCVGQIPGCAACGAETLRATRRSGAHVCDELCAMQAVNRSSPDGHARSHAPKHHACGALIDDRRGRRYEEITICGWGTCVQFLCPGCGGFIAGYGPAGCACDAQPCGHGAYIEQVPPQVRRRLRELAGRRG